MDVLMSELFDFTEEFVEGAPQGLLVALIPYFIIFVGAVAGRWAKAWIGPFFILFGGVFLQIYKKVFGTYEINIVWLVVSVIVVCASFISLQFIKRPTIKYINDTLYVGDLVTLLVFGAFLGYGVLKITSSGNNLGFLPCMLIALIITVITVFLYETVTSIFVTAAGSSGLLLAINQLRYYNPYEETPDNTFLFSLFLKVFLVGAVLQTVVFFISSDKTIKRKKWEEEEEKKIKEHEEEIKKYEEERIELERKRAETLEGAIGVMSPEEKVKFANDLIEMAAEDKIKIKEQNEAYEAQKKAEFIAGVIKSNDDMKQREYEEERIRRENERQLDEWRRQDMGW
ncbi:MAG: hypothetical protein K5754_08930 [Butyrivibrio sp.]|nr:hypothetical protein [Butyrivibrio sp.]